MEYSSFLRAPRCGSCARLGVRRSLASAGCPGGWRAGIKLEKAGIIPLFE